MHNVNKAEESAQEFQRLALERTTEHEQAVEDHEPGVKVAEE